MNHSALDNWQRLTDALWDLTEDHPVIALLCRTWAFQIANEVNPKTTPAFSEQTSHPPFNIQSRTLTCDVVFAPCLDRSNYLGTCNEVLKNFKSSNPDLSAGILTTGLSERALNQLIKTSEWPLLSGPNFRAPLLRHLPQVHHITQRIEERVNAIKELAPFFRRHRSDKFQRISGDIERIAAFKHWLTAINCKCVVIPNEQLEPASHLVCAAKELQIETIQLLHGIPTQLYHPMLSDQLWLWDEAQAQTFQKWGLTKSRIHVSGFLEPIHIPDAPATKSQTPSSRNWLFASQWQGAALWGQTHFHTAAKWVAQSQLPSDTQLTVRFHPQDTESDKTAIKKLFEHWTVAPRFTDKQTPLGEQMTHVQGVITASSSVGYIAGVMGLPTAILWDPAMTGLHGDTHFPGSTRIEGPEALTQFIAENNDRRLEGNPFTQHQQSALTHTVDILGDEARKKSQEKWSVSATHTGEHLLPDPGNIHFGIVIPNLNQGSFLEEALKSVIEQDWPHRSLVIMDGGSTDNSIEVIREYEEQAKNVRIGPDGGQTHAIAAGFHQIPEATHLLWLNSDDRLLPGALSTFARMIKREPRHALYIGAGWQISGDGRRRLVLRDEIRWPTVRLWPQQYFLQPATMISRPAYEAVMGVNPDVLHAMDYDLWLRLLHHHSAKCFSTPVCEVQMHPQQKTARIRNEVLWETLALCFDDGGRKDALQLGSHLLRHEPQFASWAAEKGLQLFSRLSKFGKS